MSCDETQQALSLYIDDELTAHFRAACDEHLQECPVCRTELSDLRAVSRSLSRIQQPAIPVDLSASISRAVSIEAAASRRRQALPVWLQVERWLQPRIMPYTIGAFASTLLFFGMLTALRPHLVALHDAEVAARIFDVRSSRAAAIAGFVIFDITKPVSPEGLAAIRAPFGVESPSLNPRGALAALTVAAAHGHSGDDDMVVVTDVFTDGRAAVADVMQAPRDKRMLTEFQDALRENAAFVPAAFDRRPQTMRVVFVFQKVDVRERGF
jgi:predicted anti-sigma-YlaC factor YlaD